MSNLFVANRSSRWTPNTRFPYLRGMGSTGQTFASTGRLVGLWVPAEMFRKGTMVICEEQANVGITTSARIGGDGDPLQGVLTQGWNGSDGFSLNNVSRHMWVQDTDGLIATFRQCGSWNGDAGADDGPSMEGIANPSVFIQPWNFVQSRISSSTTDVVFSSIEIIPGPSASGLRYQELLDV